MKRVTCIKPFSDLADKCEREIGDVWECSDERAKALENTEYGALVSVEAVKAASNRKAKATKE